MNIIYFSVFLLIFTFNINASSLYSYDEIVYMLSPHSAKQITEAEHFILSGTENSETSTEPDARISPTSNSTDRTSAVSLGRTTWTLRCEAGRLHHTCESSIKCKNARRIPAAKAKYEADAAEDDHVEPITTGPIKRPRRVSAASSGSFSTTGSTDVGSPIPTPIAPRKHFGAFSPKPRRATGLRLADTNRPIIIASTPSTATSTSSNGLDFHRASTTIADENTNPSSSASTPASKMAFSPADVGYGVGDFDYGLGHYDAAGYTPASTRPKSSPDSIRDLSNVGEAAPNSSSADKAMPISSRLPLFKATPFSSSRGGSPKGSIVSDHDSIEEWSDATPPYVESDPIEAFSGDNENVVRVPQTHKESFKNPLVLENVSNLVGVKYFSSQATPSYRLLSPVANSMFTPSSLRTPLSSTTNDTFTPDTASTYSSIHSSMCSETRYAKESRNWSRRLRQERRAAEREEAEVEKERQERIREESRMERRARFNAWREEKVALYKDAADALDAIAEEAHKVEEEEYIEAMAALVADREASQRAKLDAEQADAEAMREMEALEAWERLWDRIQLDTSDY